MNFYPGKTIFNRSTDLNCLPDLDFPFFYQVCDVVPEGYPDFSGFISHYKVPDSSYDPVAPSKLLDFGGRNDPSNKINSLILICNVCNFHTVTLTSEKPNSLATSTEAFALGKSRQYSLLFLNEPQEILFADGVAEFFTDRVNISRCVPFNFAAKILLLHDKVCYQRFCSLCS